MARFCLALVTLACLVSLAASHGVYNLVTGWTTAATTAARTGGSKTRTFALTHLAIYRTLTTKKLSSFKGANVIAAGNFAGHFVLSSLYPGLQSSVFDPLIKSELSSLTLSKTALAKSRALGKFHALALIRARENDGSQDYLPYIPTDPVTASPGEYLFTPNQTFVVAPNGGNIRPLVPAVKAKNYDAGGPYAPSSPAFLADLAEVKAIGSINSTSRSLYQTRTAQFYDLKSNTSDIPGQWFAIARHYISPQNPNLTPVETSRIYTILAIAQYEAATLIWYQKYKYHSWRPITAIRATDAAWTPLLATPPHPEYPSGHSIMAAASAYALSRAVKSTVDTKVANFSIGSENNVFPSRYFTNLKDIVLETGESRIYGGIHFRKAVTDGISLGYKIGKAVFDKFSF